ncbi:MAG: DUF2092 domain-containing protein [Desulfobacterales bacterium]|jgi:hypothetical protein|nr:DUF2092 domain-containing protein [Desulfobacterales bacterium]
MPGKLGEYYRSFRAIAASVLVVAALLLGGGAALAQDAASAQAPATTVTVGTAPAAEKKGASAPAAAAIENDRDPKAMEILMRMANYLAKAPFLRVTVLSSYDAIQEDGEVIEFGDRRRFELQRPDRLRVEVERSDGDKGELIFDGKAITAYRPADNLYAVIEKPGTVDAVMVYVVKDLQIPVPLARMFTTTFPQQMEKLVKSIAYVETNRLFDVPTDHLAVRGDEADFQIWIAQGDAPLPRRVIITYKNAPGEPQFRAMLNDWSLAAADAGRFAFSVPAGAEKVPFIVRGSSRRPAAEQKGGAK